MVCRERLAANKVKSNNTAAVNPAYSNFRRRCIVLLPLLDTDTAFFAAYGRNCLNQAFSLKFRLLSIRFKFDGFVSTRKMSSIAISRQFDGTLSFAICSHIVTDATRSFWKAFLHGLAWILFAIAGLVFLAGGKVISESAKIDRILAEMLGLMIAFALGALGYVLKSSADDLNSDQDPPTQ